MPPVNLDDASEPEEPPHGPNLVTGAEHLSFRERSYSTDSFRRLTLSRRELMSNRPRAQSESMRRLERPRLSRQLSPRMGESRRKLFAHSRSNSSPEVMTTTVERLSTAGGLDNVAEDEHQETEVDGKDVNTGIDSVLHRQDTVTSNGSFIERDEEDARAGTPFDFDSPLSLDPTRRSIADTGPRVIYLCGYPLPLWMTNRPNATRMTAWIAQHSFCCSRERLSLTTTNQSILLRMSTLCAFLGMLQAGSASYLLVVSLSDSLVDRNAQHNSHTSEETVPSLWNVNTFVMLAGLLGTFILIIMICARSTFREIEITGSLRFMWLMLWIIPLEVLAAVGMFDYHGVTEVWIKHWWPARLMAWFRSKFCLNGTYNTECVVPIGGLPNYTSEDEWCKAFYDSDNCDNIRNAAQGQMTTFSYTYYNVNGALGVLVVVMLSLTVNFLESIITRPIVQKSRESNIPLWLTLPIIGCFMAGSITLFSPSSILQRNAGSENFWPGVLYLCAGSLYLIAAILGYFLSHFAVLNQRDKRTKRLAVFLFIVVMVTSLVIVACIFVQSILLSTNVYEIDISDQLRGELACSIAESSCSFCDNDEGKQECPEWTVGDVQTVLQTQLKSSAALAAIFMIYSIGALRFGFLLRSHIMRYQIDYV